MIWTWDVEAASPVVKLIDTQPLAAFLRAAPFTGHPAATGVTYLTENGIDEGGPYRVYPAGPDHYVGELADGTKFVTYLSAVVEYLAALGQDVPDDLQALYDAEF